MNAMKYMKAIKYMKSMRSTKITKSIRPMIVFEKLNVRRQKNGSKNGNKNNQGARGVYVPAG